MLLRFQRSYKQDCPSINYGRLNLFNEKLAIKPKFSLLLFRKLLLNQIKYKQR